MKNKYNILPEAKNKQRYFIRSVKNKSNILSEMRSCFNNKHSQMRSITGGQTRSVVGDQKTKSKRKVNKKDIYAPGLPEEEIKKLREELSNPNLIPQPYIFDSRASEPDDKMKKIVNELVAEYNRKVAKFIEEEKKAAFEAGRQEERRGLNGGQRRSHVKLKARKRIK